MTKVLVVDDSPVDRLLVSGLLRKVADLQVQTVDSPQLALDVVEHWLPDVIVTDWIMPEMNGLEFVRKMKGFHPDIPIILMTSHGDESMALEALEQGAASYVPKSQLSARLQETLNQVIARLHANLSRKRLMSCVADLDVTFALPGDLALVPPLVNYVQRQLAGMRFCDANGRVRIGIAFEEALKNAICHGTLELGHAETDACYEELAAERRSLSPYRDRRVMVRVHLSNDEHRFVIRDQGAGFQVPSRSSVSPSQQLRDERGRGLILIRAFMDEVTFNETGNELTLVKLPDRVRSNLAEAISRRTTSKTDQEVLLLQMLEHFVINSSPLEKSSGGRT